MIVCLKMSRLEIAKYSSLSLTVKTMMTYFGTPCRRPLQLARTTGRRPQTDYQTEQDDSVRPNKIIWFRPNKIIWFVRTRSFHSSEHDHSVHPNKIIRFVQTRSFGLSEHIIGCNNLHTEMSIDSGVLF